MPHNKEQEEKLDMESKLSQVKRLTDLEKMRTNLGNIHFGCNISTKVATFITEELILLCMLTCKHY